MGGGGRGKVHPMQPRLSSFCVDLHIHSLQCCRVSQSLVACFEIQCCTGTRYHNHVYISPPWLELQSRGSCSFLDLPSSNFNDIG